MLCQRHVFVNYTWQAPSQGKPRETLREACSGTDMQIDHPSLLPIEWSVTDLDCCSSQLAWCCQGNVHKPYHLAVGEFRLLFQTFLGFKLLTQVGAVGNIDPQLWEKDWLWGLGVGVLVLMLELSRSYLMPYGGQWKYAWLELMGKECFFRSCPCTWNN